MKVRLATDAAHDRAINALIASARVAFVDRNHLQRLMSSAVEGSATSKMPTKEYEREMWVLRGELVAMQEWVKATGAKVCLVFEGLGSAGKGGTIHRITERTSPRVFKRYVTHFPSGRQSRVRVATRSGGSPPPSRTLRDFTQTTGGAPDAGHRGKA